MLGTIQGGRAELGVTSLQPQPFLWEICTSQKLAQPRAITLLALSRESSAVAFASPPKNRSVQVVVPT